MAFLKRLLFYILGIGLGTLIVLAFFGERDFDYAYGPNARVRKTFRTKAVDSTQMNWPELNLAKDSVYFHAVVDGRVKFGESEPRKEPCGSYTLYFSWEAQSYRMKVEDEMDALFTQLQSKIEQVNSYSANEKTSLRQPREIINPK